MSAHPENIPTENIPTENIRAIDFSKLPQGLNTSTSKLKQNIATNIRRQLPQLRTYQPQDRALCIVAGGPSLADTFGELTEKIERDNAAVLAVNGAYGHLLEHGIEPSLFAMLDARLWNKRFVEATGPRTKHFIASQCDPAVFDALADREVYIWHAPIPRETGDPRANVWQGGRKLYRGYYLSDRNYLIVPGGVTVTAKTVMLAYWLGFRHIHIFGFDSCWMDGEHHAYEQPENKDRNVRFKLGERWFNCAPWMAHQADSFFKFVVNLPDNLNLVVHGDGLIAYGLSQSAEAWDRLTAA